MNKNEIAFVNNLIRTLDLSFATSIKGGFGCSVCSEIVGELKLLQSGKVTSRQVRLTCLND